MQASLHQTPNEDSSHYRSCSPDFPLEILDAHFVVCLLVIIEPLALAQAVYAFKLGSRVYAVRKPFAFW